MNILLAVGIAVAGLCYGWFSVFGKRHGPVRHENFGVNYGLIMTGWGLAA